MAKNCWEIRPCPKDMLEHCAFSLQKVACTIKCQFGICHSPKQEIASDPELLFSSVQRPTPAKEACFMCKFYLENSAVADPA